MRLRPVNTGLRTLQMSIPKLEALLTKRPLHKRAVSQRQARRAILRGLSVAKLYCTALWNGDRFAQWPNEDRSLLLQPVFRFRVIVALPFHIGRFVGTAAKERNNIVLNPARSEAAILSCCRARIIALERGADQCRSRIPFRRCGAEAASTAPKHGMPTRSFPERWRAIRSRERPRNRTSRTPKRPAALH